MKNRLNITEEWISKVEDREVEITDTEQKKRKNNEKKRGQFKGFWGNMKLANIYGVPRRIRGQRTYLKQSS